MNLKFSIHKRNIEVRKEGGYWKKEEKEIMEDGEIMKMANPEDEGIEEDSDSPKEI